MLKISCLSKSFNNKSVLKNITFTAAPGTITVFLGTSGTGKSTILRLISGLESADQGTLEFNSQPLEQKDVGMVFQSFNLFPHLTVEENITLSLIHVFKKTSAEAQQIAKKLLQQYQLEDFSQAYPGSLSGGQRQRVALARTLATNPKIVCLDEPTSALDPILTMAVAKIITLLAKNGLTVIIATHDTDLIKQLDCTIHLMNQGSIQETASTKTLIENSSAYPQLKSFLHL
jgi:polar amino acid transport system ATP-binding protein